MLTAGITKIETVMADGRELIYYDDAGSTLPKTRRPDARHLDARPPTATMRQDPLTGEWISIAAARQSRAFLPPTEQDPLAPASADNPSEVPDDYDVVVFENRSPAFGPELGSAEAGRDGEPVLDNLGLGSHANSGAARGDRGGIALGRTAPAVGRCEVVSFGPSNTGSFAELPEKRARTVLEAWADRTAALSAMPGIEQVFPFENRGEAIGVTLHHPHGQIYGYPYVTPRTSRLLESIDTFGPGLFEGILEFERHSERVVLSGEHFTAFVPFAARWPLEVHLLPHRQVPDLAATTSAERDELSMLYRRLLRGFDALYGTPTPYIAAWHQAPVAVGRDDIRLMLQVTSPRRAEDKLKYLAGSEAAMGAWIGDILPEQAADAVRRAIARA